MFPLKNNIHIDRSASRNLYLQICDQIIKLIKSGKLSPSTKLPGSRKLAEDLNTHRKTIIAAYDELIVQGWIITIPAKGTFVNNDLPIINPINLNKGNISDNTTKTINFTFKKRPDLTRSTINITPDTLTINDGVPDHRLAPIDEIAKIYRNITKKAHHQDLLTYNSIYGNLELRKTLVTYLNQTRGIHITTDNILITRGSQMGIYLASRLLLQSKDIIIVGNTNYNTANITFTECGGIIERVDVDQNGLNTNAIASICKIKKIKAVYVTSHHHHPTTVALSAERRMHLLELARTYNFAIIEDDYDYDFHYSNSPILPLASNDNYGNVIYIGGITKIIAPAMRIGYLIAPKDFVDEAANYRAIIDRQGDTILEQTLSSLIKSGDVSRHSNKVLKIYKTRRDLFCSLLKEKLGSYCNFETPKGGMAVWVKLNEKYCWDDIKIEAKKHKLEIGNWKNYDSTNQKHNGIRMGFASFNNEEIHQVINRLQRTIEAIDNQ